MIERYSRGVRWFHAATYITVLVLLGTGWWLLLGNEGDPSPLARLVRLPDTTLHTWIGWALTALAALAVTVGVRAARTFAAETLRLIASGVLPGYRGVARAMHLGGRPSIEVARRVWPAWAERVSSSEGSEAAAEPARGRTSRPSR
jgi:Prokaryotic cytochrome b561